MGNRKESIQDLAILGGSPAFANALHVGKPRLVDRDLFLQKVNGILDREWYTNSGPVLREFEEEVALRASVKHCIAVCNGTKALEITIRALGLTGEVIVPAFTFVATAHALYWQGVVPVFCDIEPDAHQIDVERIEKLITPRTSAILAVHLWGNACDIDELEKLAEKHNLRLVFDASHSFGTTYKGRTVGTFGDAEAVSFHATKMIQTFEGGAILTNSDSLAEKSRLMTNFGFVDYDEVGCIGTNGKLSEIHAAMGLTCLKHLQPILESYKQRHECYQELLKDIPRIRLVPHKPGGNHQYVVIEITHDLPKARDLLCRVLQEEGVIARRYFYPGCHNMAPYNSFPTSPDVPITDEIASKVVVLPSGPSVTNSDVEGIAAIIVLAMRDIERLSKNLEGRE